MRLIALLLLLAIGQAYGSAQTGRADHAADSHAQNAHPLKIDADHVNPSEIEQKSADASQGENRNQLYKNVEICLTFAIALAALVQAICAFLQWRIYSHQLKTSMPLVVIDWENLIHLSPPDINIQSGPQVMVHHFHWDFRNVGPTPAFILETSARFVIVPASQGIPKMDYADPKPYVGEPLFTEQRPVEGMRYYTRIEDPRSYEDIEASYRGQKETLYAFGYVRFRDRYGKRHRSNFCLRYYAWKDMRRDYDGFGVAGKKQNKYT
jgi:hypothetical protein